MRLLVVYTCMSNYNQASSNSMNTNEPSISTDTFAFEGTISRLQSERDSAIVARDKAIAARDSAIAARDKALADVERLRASHQCLKEELLLLKRRIFIAKAERFDVSQLELEFAEKVAELDALQAGIAAAGGEGGGSDDEGDGAGNPSQPDENTKPKTRPKPKGRRRVEDLETLPIEEVLLGDETPLPEGWRVIGHEESWKLGWRAGTFVRIRYLRPQYEIKGPLGPTVLTPPMPKEVFPRLLAAPSLLAHIAVDKFCDGLPLFRQAERFARIGLDLDRSVMSRWLEDLGATLGATIVEAMRKDAIATAFCLATDATGIAIQPPRDAEPGTRKPRKPCKRGHIFVTVADRDHIFYAYTPKETSAAVQAMFHGFSGYVQADAKSVFNVLFIPPEKQKSLIEGVEPDGATREEVGCWAHARRKFWESAIAKNAVAREALLRIHRIYEMDKSWKGKPPATIKVLRDQRMRPELDDFFAWAQIEHDRVKHEKGSLRSAFGYALRQQAALMRPLNDGKLPLDNNRSERALRKIAIGRKNWLFAGSDDHADAATNIMSIIASARLHGIEPEQYIRDLLRLIPYCPKASFLDLTPKYWKATRASLDPAQLAAELGHIDLPKGSVEE